ncbi:MAG: BBP7 family outer membrane beta-barrel protein [Planctomycetales bacterium]|nr:BBP7 family outer membrane beta-barrel protein [Planctomycetales bacterium]
MSRICKHIRFFMLGLSVAATVSPAWGQLRFADSPVLSPQNQPAKTDSGPMMTLRDSQVPVNQPQTGWEQHDATNAGALIQLPADANSVPADFQSPAPLAGSVPAESQPPLIQDSQVQPSQFTDLDPQVPSALSEGSLVVPNASPSLPPPVSPELSSALNSVTGGGEYAESLPVTDAISAYPGDETMVPMSDGFVSQFEAPLPTTGSPMFFSTGDWFRRGIWYSQTEAVMLLKTEVTDLLYGADQSLSTIGDRPTLNSIDAAFTYEPGARLTLGRFLGQDTRNRDHSIEFVFLGLFDYAGFAELQSTTSDRLQTAIGPSDYIQFGEAAFGSSLAPILNIGVSNDTFVDGFTLTNRQTLTYQSSFDNYEINYRLGGRPPRDRIALQPNGTWVRHASSSRIRSGILGFRAVALNDYMRYTGESITRTNHGEYEVKTRNMMAGIQLGGSLQENYGDWSWGLNFKTAGLINFVNRVSRLDTTLGLTSNGEPVIDRQIRREDIQDEYLTVLIEAGLGSTYQFRPNLVGRLSYDFMYLTGVANAPENMDLGATFPKLNLTGDAFYHGLSVGVEMLW